MGDLVRRLQTIRDSLNDWDHPINGQAAIDEAIAELQRLRAMVDTWPKTLDGVPFVPNMEVWGVLSSEDDPNGPRRLGIWSTYGLAEMAANRRITHDEATKREADED